MSKRGFRVLDSDLHVIEPPDLYERYLDKAHKHRPPRTVDASHGYVRHWEIEGYTFPRALGRGRTEADSRAKVILREYAAAGFDAAFPAPRHGSRGDRRGGPLPDATRGLRGRL